MRGYLLDTNHLGEALRPNSISWPKVEQARAAEIRFGTIIPVLCELEAGIQQTAHIQRNRNALTRLLADLRVWPLDLDTTRHYGRIHVQLRQKGRALSKVDLMIAAMCFQLDLTLHTSDRDFEALPDLRCENWLADPPGA
jgi:tRNA(fMet)-specific endonuclease VapC